ncbi:MAG: hypothetical protein ACC652_03635 [Acidimicrobiales bacterium]
MSDQITDLDELIREVDRLAGHRAWDELDRLRVNARKAFEHGHQLWPAGDWAAYRIAREADGELAAKMVNEDAARFAFGPLTEVAASSHNWASLEPYLDAGPARTAVFVERLLRGEKIEPPDDYSQHLEAPARLCDWEPDYCLATYHLDRVEVPDLPLTRFAVTQLAHSDLALGDSEACDALERIVAHWRHQADIPVHTAAVVGNSLDAVAQLCADTNDVRIVAVDTPQALQYLAYVGASSGVSTGRKGAAAARDAAVAALVAVAGLDVGASAEDIGEAAGELRWFLWDSVKPRKGLACRIAVEDPEESLAWALDAFLPALKK